MCVIRCLGQTLSDRRLPFEAAQHMIPLAALPRRDTVKDLGSRQVAAMGRGRGSRRAPRGDGGSTPKPWPRLPEAHMCMCTHTRAHGCAHMPTRTCTHAHTRTHTHTHTLTPTYRPVFVHVETRTQPLMVTTQVCTQTCSHTQVTRSLGCSPVSVLVSRVLCAAMGPSGIGEGDTG